MSRLLVNLKNPCRKPKQYTDSIESLASNQSKNFKMANQTNEPIPDLSKGFISPNKTDFIYFDPNNGEVAIVEDMKPSEEFVTMKPYNVPSKKYIVINNDYQFIIFDFKRY